MNCQPTFCGMLVEVDGGRLKIVIAIKIYNERGEFGAKAHVTDDVPPGVL